MIKKRKKILNAAALVASVSLVSISVTACASPLSFESSVQLVVSDNFSTLADQSFSESSYDGIRDYFKNNGNIELPVAASKEIKENNGIWKKPGVDTVSRIASYRYAVQDGAKIVVATGFNQGDALQQLTSTKPENKQFKNSFTDNGFIFVDGGMVKDAEPFKSDPYNVSSISYRADDGSFLSGISTAVFLNLYQDYFTEGKTAKDKDGNKVLAVSSFVGLAFGSTLNFMNGFRLGIHYWNKVLQPLIPTVNGEKTKPTLPIKWVSGNEKDPDDLNLQYFVSGSFSANEQKATILSEGMRKNGANVIFPIAGPQTQLVVNGIVSKQDHSEFARSIVLGVDTAQEKTKSLEVDLPKGEKVGKDANHKGKIIQFSSVKNLAGSVNGVLEAITQGRNGNGVEDHNGYYGLGWNNVGTVENAGVGVSDAGLQYLINPNWNEWGVQNLDFSKVTLESLVENKTAKVLSAEDPVIKQYIALLNEDFKTKKDPKKEPTPLDLKAYEIFDKESTGLNGPMNDGSWRIKNNTKGENGDENNYLSLDLSNFLKGIKNKITKPDGKVETVDVTYTVPHPLAQYEAITSWPKANELFKKDKMFFRKS